MGWKNIKDHYRIDHIVRIEDGKICIGSGYVHDLVTICPNTGMVTENRTFDGFLSKNYPHLINVSPDEVLALINAPDSFSQSLTVYTWKDGEILEKQCEEYEWPNVTHDGMVMYENTFSPDKQLTIQRAKRNAMAGVRILTDSVKDAEARLAECRSRLQFEINQSDKLDLDYPDVVIEDDDN